MPHHVASNYMLGAGMLVPIPDIDRTDFMLIIGANPVVSNGSLMTAPGVLQRMKGIQKRGGKVVVVDPRKTKTAKIADQHIFIRPEKDAFLLVKQFRAPVYLNDESHLCTYELCAGIIDKEISLAQIVKEEIDEECGYDVALESIEKITSFYTNVGVSGGCQSLFFATINESMKIHNGGGINDEEIDLMFLPLNKIEEFLYDESKAKTPGLMFSFYWFLKNKRTL